MARLPTRLVEGIRAGDVQGVLLGEGRCFLRDPSWGDHHVTAAIAALLTERGGADGTGQGVEDAIRVVVDLFEDGRVDDATNIAWALFIVVTSNPAGNDVTMFDLGQRIWSTLKRRGPTTDSVAAYASLTANLARYEQLHIEQSRPHRHP